MKTAWICQSWSLDDEGGTFSYTEPDYSYWRSVKKIEYVEVDHYFSRDADNPELNPCLATTATKGEEG